jgi:hypothetical protein
VARTTEAAAKRKDIDAIEAEAQTILREIETERRSLRPLILAGVDTEPVRGRIAALEEKLADAKTRIEEIATERYARLAHDAARDARDIAGKLVTAIAAKLAALEPPAQPTK